MSMNNRRLIIHVVTSTRLDHGGPSLSVTQLLDHQRLEGLEGHLLCPDHRNDTSLYAPISATSISSLEKLSEFVSPNSISGMHIHGIWEPFLHRCVTYARKRKLPYAISPHGMLEPWALTQRKWKKRLAWWLYQRADLWKATFLLATAPSEAQQFRHIGLRNPVEILPNGIEFPDAIPERSNVNQDKVALFLSRIHPKKGLPMLAEAWARLRPQGWRMLVIGPDDHGHRTEMESLVSRLGLSSCWSFNPPVYGPEKAQAFVDADLFILPTYSENFGIAVAEALAHKLPVITTDQAPWQGLQEHQCGWWVPANVDGIHEALQQATRLSSGDLQSMGQRGRDWVKEEFAWPSISQRLIRIYEEHFP
jgi:glycosyltransferase involved in cell wall biosynthesis